MPDFLDKEQRSARMKLIRSKDTKPELAVRRIVWKSGRRYRLHVAALPGKPDLVFAKDRKIILVHGCFWHLHAVCRRYSSSSMRDEYWALKLHANKKRDKRNMQALRDLGWRILVVWECELRDADKARKKISKFLSES